MPDREKVIKGLAEISEYALAKADIAGIGKGKEVFDRWYRAAEDALAILREQEPVEPTVGGWISVKDKLPELGELVLVAIYGTDVIKPMDGETLAEAVQRSLNSPGRVDVGFRDRDGYWTDYMFCGPMIVTPSYWMPVPEPPKNNGEE